MGRPPTRPVTLRDGFYIEVRNKGASNGIKIRSENAEQMNAAADDYRKSKEVVVLGEHKKGRWLNEDAQAAIDKAKAKEAKALAKAQKSLFADIDEMVANAEVSGDLDKGPAKKADATPKEKAKAAKPVAKVVAKPAPKAVAKPAAKPVAKKAAKPAAKAKPAPKAKAKPAAKAKPKAKGRK